MAYTVQTLITQAFYLSRVVTANAQVVTGEQITLGLQLLNQVISSLTINDVLIPYYTYTSFNTVAGQELYFIAGLLDLDTLTFNQGSVRFPTQELTRWEYFAPGRVDSVQTLPFTFNIQRTLGGSNINFYPIPNAVYEIRLQGKYALNEFTGLTQDMELTLDDYFIALLRFYLAKYICMQYSISFNPEANRELERLQNNSVNISPPDITMRKDSTLGTGRSNLTWAQFSFPSGWGAPT